MRLPSKKTSPLVGSRNPPIILSVVVLPQPDGPRKVTNPDPSAKIKSAAFVSQQK